MEYQNQAGHPVASDLWPLTSALPNILLPTTIKSYLEVDKDLCIYGISNPSMWSLIFDLYPPKYPTTYYNEILLWSRQGVYAAMEYKKQWSYPVTFDLWPLPSQVSYYLPEQNPTGK